MTYQKKLKPETLIGPLCGLGSRTDLLLEMTPGGGVD